LFSERSIQVLKKLSESFGPAGFERETAQIVKEYVQTFSDEISTDKLGSIIFRKRGSTSSPKILLAGHIDEVGFVVSGIDKDTGFLTFNPLGGWFDQVLLSQRVRVRTSKNDVLGVIAAKPPHLLPEEEANKVVKKEQMFIDIGATNREDAERLGVRIGDAAVPWSPFMTLREGTIAMGKGFDDRVGTFVAMETIRRLKEERINHPNTVFGVATVQEEVGLRGAATSAYLIEPDAAIVCEVDIAGDVPGIKPHEAPTRMGRGPSILTYDSSMIPNQLFKSFVIETAEDLHIPYQLSIIARGGTDAGRIHMTKGGCPSIVISVPTRHIHSHVGLFSFEDVENTVKLLNGILQRLDNDTVKGFTSI
jgi:endoglucanase